MRRLLSVIVTTVAVLWSGPLWPQAADGVTKPPKDRVETREPQADAPKADKAAKDSIRAPGVQSEFPKRSESPPTRVSVDRAKADKTAKDSIRSLDLQTEFPKKVEPTRPLRLSIPEELIWIALACAVALVLYALRDPLLSLLRRNDKEDWAAPAGAADESAATQDVDALAAADTLSREGRFVEAMHMLLLQSLADIRQQLGEHFADSLTSREILRGARLPPQGRTSLRDIIAAVERTYFGGYPAARDDYMACRRSFDSLRLAMNGGISR
jgi:hypothetical protein